MTASAYLLFLPVALPIAGFAAALAAAGSRNIQKVLTLGTALLYLVVALGLFKNSSHPMTLVFGGWQLPFGISFTADVATAALLVVTGLIFFTTVLYSVPGLNAEDSPFFFPAMNVLIAGVSGAFLTRDLFNLYVWFEVILIASFTILSLGRSRFRLAGALKYVVLNLISSALFLTAAGFVYNAVHTLDFADSSARLSQLYDEGSRVTLISMLLLVSFSIKAAIVPFHFWLPAAYHHLSPAISALFAGLLTKVGIYAIIRVCLLVFPVAPLIEGVLSVLGPLTIMIGVLGAISQTNIRRILGFHIVSQIGYLATAALFIASPNPELRYGGIVAAMFYMIHHIFVKANLYLVAGLIRQYAGSELLTQLGGLKAVAPVLLILFAAPALSLIGIPPTSGFWAKFSMLKIAAEHGLFFHAAIMLLGGFFTAFSMIKIWIGAFFGEYGAAQPVESFPRIGVLSGPVVACVVLTVISISIGLDPDFLMGIATASADQLLPTGGR